MTARTLMKAHLQARITRCIEHERIANAAYDAAVVREGHCDLVDEHISIKALEAQHATRLAKYTAAAFAIQAWVRVKVLPRPRDNKKVVNRMDPSHSECPVCAGPLTREAPCEYTGFLFVAECQRCLYRVGDGTTKVRMCYGGRPYEPYDPTTCAHSAHYYEDGGECEYCDYMSEGCQCDAGVYAGTYVEMRCECGPPCVGNHGEMYKEFVARVAAAERPTRKRARSDVTANVTKGGKRARGGSL